MHPIEPDRSLRHQPDQPVGPPQMPYLVAYPPMDPEPEPQDGGWDLLVKLWRRKLLILGVVCVCGGVAVLAGQSLAPRYEATAEVLVGGLRPEVSRNSAELAQTNMDADAIRTEGHVIASRTLAEKVSKSLALNSHPEFNPSLRQEETLAEKLGIAAAADSLGKAAGAFFAMFGGTETETDEADQSEKRQPVVDQESRIVSKLLSGLTVEPMARSHVLNITAAAGDPELAAKIANRFADEYVVHRLHEQEGAIRRANGWLDERLTSLQTQLSEAEAAVEIYRRENNLFSVRSETVVGQQMAELNSRLVEARSNLAEAEAKLTHAEATAGSAGDAESIPSVLQSPLIISLRTEKSGLERKIAELRAEYTDKHPTMVAMLAQLSDIEQGIATEIERIIAGLRQEADIARQRLDRVEARMGEVEMQMGASNAQTVELRQLEREAEATRAMYESLLLRSKETAFQAGILEPGAKILSAAVVPGSASFPPKKLLLVVGVLAGAVIGIVLALIIEKLDNTFRTPEDLEDHTSIPNLAVLPRTARRWSGRCDEVVRRPLSPYTDALRMIWAQLSLENRKGDLPGVTLFTSAAAGEGKSHTSCSYARLMAAEGKKVVLVDLDWRQPTQHRLFGEKFRRTDMVNLLSGDVSPEEAVFVDRQTGLHVIFNGRLGKSQGRAVQLDRILALLRTLSNYYDVVVVDTSPLQVTPMVLHLARAADRVVMCVKWGSTRRQAVVGEVRNLLRVGVHVSGTVITQVEPKKYRRYSEGSSYYARTSPVMRSAA
ncbi:MAG: polysaccharide biosynthesis tyrosine autokinase [Alphaproteobacteria bacterium]